MRIDVAVEFLAQPILQNQFAARRKACLRTRLGIQQKKEVVKAGRTGDAQGAILENRRWPERTPILKL